MNHLTFSIVYRATLTCKGSTPIGSEKERERAIWNYIKSSFSVKRLLFISIERNINLSLYSEYYHQLFRQVFPSIFSKAQC